jgi:hypothetical protein
VFWFEVQIKTKVTNGPGSRDAVIAMGYKLIDAAHARWRAINAPPGRPGPRWRGPPQGLLQLRQTCRLSGQMVLASGYGTRFTNDGTGHGMFVSIENVSPI